MLRDFVLWWTRQMRALLPRRLLPDTERADALLIAAQAPHLLLTLRRRGRDTLLGRFGMSDEGLAAANRALRHRPRRVVLQLAAGTLLERPVELPLAAERDVDRVIGFEMDRLTPFTAADVVWQAVVTRRDQAQRQLLLQLSLVPRRALQPCLDLLVRAGLTPTLLEGDTVEGTRRCITLVEHGAHRSYRPVAVAAGLVAVLAIAAVVAPFVMQRLASDATEREIAALSPSVARVEAFRKHLADGSAGSDALAAERARVGDVLQVLATVTDLMPDDTWLTELSLHQGKLNVAGQSPAAARLIPALAAEPTLRNPAFAAPVTRAPDGHADLFVIRADLAP